MIKIDKETLEKWKISPNCVWNLYCIENKLDFTKDSLEVICNKQDKLIIINNDTNVINITKKGLDILKDFMVISGSKEDKVVLEKDFYKAQILVRMFDDPRIEGHLPRPFGVFYETERPCYEAMMEKQLQDAKMT